MKKTRVYKNRILLLLFTIFFIGCSAKEKSDNASTNSPDSRKSTIQLDSLDNLEAQVKLTKNIVDKNSLRIENIIADIAKFKDKKNNANPISLFFLSIVINIIFILISIGILLILYKRAQEKNRKKRNSKSQKNNVFEKNVDKALNDIEKLHIKLDNAIKRIVTLEHRNAQKIDTQKKDKETQNTSKTNSNSKVDNIKQPTRYLSGINQKLFTVVDTSPDGSFFKIINQKGTIAEFTLHGSEEEAITKGVFNKHNSNIIAGSLQTAKKVEIVNVGKIEQEGNNWVVTKPIEVKLI